jgi:hypothetical protein
MMMSEALYFSVVQVVPDIARGERINVGVIVWDDEANEGIARFTRQHHRLRAVGVERLAFLTDFQTTVQDALKIKGQRLFHIPGAQDEPWSVEAMRSAAKEWAGMIQLSEPHPARRNVTATKLAQDVYDRLVHLKPPAQDPDVGRQAIRRAVARTVRETLRSRFGDDPPLTVRVQSEVQGRVDSHFFDVVLSNGSATSLLVTPNLSDPRTKEVSRDLDAAAWSIQDVHARSAAIRFGLVRNGGRPALLQRIENLTTSMPIIESLTPEQVPQWSAVEADRAAQLKV